MLKHKDLLNLVDYCHLTGVFTAKKHRGNVTKGSILGSENGKNYLRIVVNKNKYLAHRLAWFYFYGVWPKDQLDHINGNRRDNRISNLREVSNEQNAKNSRLSIMSSTGIPGVYWVNKTSKFNVRVSVNKKEQHLGSYSDFFEACCVRKSAERTHGYHINHGR